MDVGKGENREGTGGESEGCNESEMKGMKESKTRPKGTGEHQRGGEDRKGRINWME